MRWSSVLLLGAVVLGVVIVAASRFNLPSVSIGEGGPTVTPSSAGNP